MPQKLKKLYKSYLLKANSYKLKAKKYKPRALAIFVFLFILANVLLNFNYFKSLFGYSSQSFTQSDWSNLTTQTFTQTSATDFSAGVKNNANS